ncbi:sensor domain-containing diguanylate cyclase [Coprothermobacteraceae bacterium]|nr:sensor domain-containing diguanylate cyclase [Coprothermobacteraceae bacterium]
MLGNLHEGAYVVTKDRRIVYWNRAAESISGFSTSEVVGSYCQDNFLKHIDESGKQLCLDECPLVEAMKLRRPVSDMLYMHLKQGARIPVDIHVIPIVKNGVAVGAVEVFCEKAEISGIRAEMQRLRSLAFVDELTGTLNRRGLEFILEDRVSEASRYKRKFAVLFIDLDNFKAVNDRYGHLVGDALLKAVSETLVHNLRASDKVGRIGGDEFVVIAELNGRDPEILARRLIELISNTFVLVDSEPVSTTASVGVTVADGSKPAKELLKQADQLMYSSKEKGRNTYTIGE